MTQYFIEKALFKSYSAGLIKLEISAVEMINIEGLAAEMDYKGLGPIDLCFTTGAYELTVNAPFMCREEAEFYLFDCVSLTVYLFEPLISDFCNWSVGLVPKTLLALDKIHYS